MKKKNFPEHIMESVELLRWRYSNRKAFVITDFPMLEILKEEKRKEVSMRLTYHAATDTFHMEAPDARYFSKMSHFTYKEPERRFIRMKAVLLAFINDLKYAHLWEKIENKDLIIVNALNERSDKEKLKKLLDSIRE